MSCCNGCARSYSLLRKEKGCPSCGFSYCSSCLNDKIFIPKLNKQAKVCQKCKNQHDHPEQDTKLEPPKAYLKRLGETQSKAKLPENSATVDIPNNLSSEDQAIAARLAKLQADKKVAPSKIVSNKDIEERINKLSGLDEAKKISDSDIEARLAKLRGEPAIASATSSALPPPDKRTDEEKTRDLIKQYMDEVELDTKNKQDFDARIDDIQLRLLALQGERKSQINPQKEHEIEESEDEEEMVKKIIADLKAKAELESTAEEEEVAPKGDDELPWCEICNEDAAVRCRGCHYLYCKRCFNEHKDDDECNSYDVYRKS